MPKTKVLFVTILALAALALPALAADKLASAIRLPFRVRNGLILIDGRVDSTKGVFMLDTGETYFRFEINRTSVPLGKGINLYRMHAASGQVSMTQFHAGRHTIGLGGALTTTADSGDPGAPDKVVSDDFRQMMKTLDSRLLGVVGYAFLKRYDFTIDYRKSVVVLYPLGSAPVFPGGVTIKFVPSSPGVPFTLRFGGMQVPTVMDTGGWEELKAPKDVWAQLERAGFVHAAAAEETDCVNLSGARYSSSAYEFDFPHVDKVIARDEKLTLGYPFLRRYVSVYSSRNGTVTLAPIGNVPPLPPASCE